MLIAQISAARSTVAAVLLVLLFIAWKLWAHRPVKNEPVVEADSPPTAYPSSYAPHDDSVEGDEDEAAMERLVSQGLVYAELMKAKGERFTAKVVIDRLQGRTTITSDQVRQALIDLVNNGECESEFTFDGVIVWSIPESKLTNDELAGLAEIEQAMSQP
jgi:hypothetical protein